MNILPTDALIVVDPQYDFVQGGALAVAGGDEIMAGIVALARDFHAAGAVIVMTQDWHPADHSSFASVQNADPFTTVQMPYGEQVLWPDHCVQRTEGGDFVDAILEVEDYTNLIIRKGMNPKIDSYSAHMENDHKTSTGLTGFLRDREVKRCYYVGLARDFCVGYSALDGRLDGFETVVIDSLTRAIDMPLPDGGTTNTVMNLLFQRYGVTVVEELI